MAWKRIREGSEEGEEVSTPMKKQKRSSLLESPGSSDSRDSQTQRGDGSTGRPLSAGQPDGRSDGGRAAREVNGNGNGDIRRSTTSRNQSPASPLPRRIEPLPTDEDLSEEGEVA